MEKKVSVDLQPENEGGLKELVLRWFIETQTQALILNNGNFPDWFHGFAARKEAEDLLRDKALGCFLVRLSDKAIGYILSYRGLDRCRHFVITQKQDGHFVISGDCQSYHSVTEVIEHYRVSPIQPFGEHLTSSCSQESTGELYDVVNYTSKGKSGVSVQALRALWDQKKHHQRDSGHHHSTQQPNSSSVAQLPALLLKSNNRKLTGTVSMGAVSLTQGAPPLPKRGVTLGLSLRESLPDKTSVRQRGSTSSFLGDLCPPGRTCSDLTQAESRSMSLQSLPQLDNDKMEEEEEEYSNKLQFTTSGAIFSPTPLKTVTCDNYSLHKPCDDLGTLRSNPLYETSEAPVESSAQQVKGLYAEVLTRPTPAGLPDDTYEQIPGKASATVHSNTYASLDDMKKSKSTWGKNNMTWKKFLPEYKKK
ncbi:hypothetical protein JOB18_016504 [Solea senegalensis]|uniref:SH2 domain-containing protein n=1 Tax=Solea senegalensis TaxID=28829 RepID=A0AAV6Q290_SOLSE|nr:SH2 domain-containing protein 7 [Solea senegalensis]KAG7482234.1 hypothetical protein JOB18_016504 [Solea senegalensis]